MSLKVGHITYANCAPFFHYLGDSGFSGEIVDGVPAELNRMLAAGELDICPSSSIEYARNASDYLLLPGHSISSVGPVQSVLLFTDRPLNRMNGVPITITGESATSIALLQVLLRQFMEVEEVNFERGDISVENMAENPLPLLLIGDKALQARQKMPESSMMIDLGELWYHYTGLPFVFALWIVNEKSASEKKDELQLFSSQLDASRGKAFKALDKLAGQSPERRWMGRKGLVDYWRKVSYDLDPAHLEGLNCFYFLLERHGLIETAPEIRFFE